MKKAETEKDLKPASRELLMSSHTSWGIAPMLNCSHRLPIKSEDFDIMAPLGVARSAFHNRDPSSLDPRPDQEGGRLAQD